MYGGKRERLAQSVSLSFYRLLHNLLDFSAEIAGKNNFCFTNACHKCVRHSVFIFLLFLSILLPNSYVIYRRLPRGLGGVPLPTTARLDPSLHV